MFFRIVVSITAILAISIGLVHGNTFPYLTAPWPSGLNGSFPIAPNQISIGFMLSPLDPAYPDYIGSKHAAFNDTGLPYEITTCYLDGTQESQCLKISNAPLTVAKNTLAGHNACTSGYWNDALWSPLRQVIIDLINDPPVATVKHCAADPTCAFCANIVTSSLASDTILIPLQPTFLPLNDSTSLPLFAYSDDVTKGYGLTGCEISIEDPFPTLSFEMTIDGNDVDIPFVMPLHASGGRIEVDENNITYCQYYWAAMDAYQTTTQGHSSFQGWALDGFPIYGRYSMAGLLPSDLDECGGHSHYPIGYHYHFSEDTDTTTACFAGYLPTLEPVLEDNSVQEKAATIRIVIISFFGTALLVGILIRIGARIYLRSMENKGIIPKGSSRLNSPSRSKKVIPSEAPTDGKGDVSTVENVLNNAEKEEKIFRILKEEEAAEMLAEGTWVTLPSTVGGFYLLSLLTPMDFDAPWQKESRFGGKKALFYRAGQHFILSLVPVMFSQWPLCIIFFRSLPSLEDVWLPNFTSENIVFLILQCLCCLVFLLSMGDQVRNLKLEYQVAFGSMRCIFECDEKDLVWDENPKLRPFHPNNIDIFYKSIIDREIVNNGNTVKVTSELTSFRRSSYYYLLLGTLVDTISSVMVIVVAFKFILISEKSTDVILACGAMTFVGQIDDLLFNLTTTNFAKQTLEGRKFQVSLRNEPPSLSLLFLRSPYMLWQVENGPFITIITLTFALLGVFSMVDVLAWENNYLVDFTITFADIFQTTRKIAVTVFLTMCILLLLVVFVVNCIFPQQLMNRVRWAARLNRESKKR